MKVSIQNLGVLKEAEFEIGDLTIICGKNNTGKTYLTHATYGFLSYATKLSYPVKKEHIAKLAKGGSITIQMSDCRKNINKILKGASISYSREFANIFAGSEHQFSNASFSLQSNVKEEFATFSSNTQASFGSVEGIDINIQPSKDRKSVRILSTVKTKKKPPQDLVAELINLMMGHVLFNNIYLPYIASAERTGIAIFQPELDFTKNRLWEIADRKGSNSPYSLKSLREEFGGIYPLATRKNIDYLLRWSSFAHVKSQLQSKHPEILDYFSSIIGGDLTVTKEGLISFAPKSSNRTRLSLLESSSTVRSLLDINFFLRHHARPGDLLIIDEPELNLHPENQCKMARLFARLVNAGVKVFISTHSDYIIKELNTLIMLKDDKGRFDKFAKKEGYDVENELIMPDQVKAYMTTPMKGKSTAGKNQTLVPMEINQDRGIRADSFDETINNMNRIQDEIIWGEL